MVAGLGQGADVVDEGEGGSEVLPGFGLYQLVTFALPIEGLEGLFDGFV